MQQFPFKKMRKMNWRCRCVCASVYASHLTSLSLHSGVFRFIRFSFLFSFLLNSVHEQNLSTILLIFAVISPF